METNKKTVKEVLEDVVDALNGIKISVKEMDEIGTPIRFALNGLNVCIDAINRAEAEILNKTDEVAEDNFELVEEETKDEPDA